MMSMENLSLIMIGLVVAVAAAGAAYLALRVWAGRMVDSDHPDPSSEAGRVARAEVDPAVSARVRSARSVADLEARH